MLLAVAGVGGGLSGSIAGLSSLVTYPALLGVGLTPVAANVTNTVALVAQSSGSVLGSRPELAGQRLRIRRLAAVSIAGGATGGLLLLLAPAGSFALVVPWLIGAASLGVLIRPRALAEDLPLPHPSTDSRLLDAATFVVATYGGYFGAAAGVMMLALLMAGTGEPLPRSNAAKNVLLGGPTRWPRWRSWRSARSIGKPWCPWRPACSPAAGWGLGWSAECPPARSGC
ncbi:sulfite exporter TauE/SafE family protein [Acidiferrimicrobium sp. IK]|nr:sulfite exporter TauE/SafE family protein [Acidiferrimicrobium sp. IK]MCU4184631.1 sulfite exporter TauE/SafE family protein [Acidiferrimicrobium sp. IK]